MSNLKARLAWVGVSLWLAGLAATVVGIGRLDATVEGAYFNRSVGAAPNDAVFATSVSGKSWLVIGVTLVALGGAALCVAAFRRG
jgi:hypothetical protein